MLSLAWTSRNWFERRQLQFPLEFFFPAHNLKATRRERFRWFEFNTSKLNNIEKIGEKEILSCVLLTLLFPLRLRILRTLRAPVPWFAVHAAILFLSRLLYDFSVGRARILVPCRLVAIPKLSSTIKQVKAMAKINKVVFSILESLCYLDENLSKLLVVDIANVKSS